MLTVKRFINNHKYAFVTVILCSVAALLGTSGQNVALFQGVPSILSFFHEDYRYIVSSLLLPFIMITCSIAFDSPLHKVLSIVYGKLVLGVILVPFGVVSNFSSQLFWGDFAALFFILVDFMLFLSLITRKHTKGISIGVLVAVALVSIFTLAINRNSENIMMHACRVLYTLLIYLSIFICTSMLVKEKHFYRPIRIKQRIQRKIDNLKLVVILLCVALCSMLTLSFVFYSSHRGIVLFDGKKAEFICYAFWCALSLLVTLCVCDFRTEKLSIHKSVGFAFLSSTVATMVVVFLNSYGHILQYDHWFGNENQFYLHDFLISDVTHSLGFAWLRYPMVFLLNFIVSFIVLIIVAERGYSSVWRSFDDEKSPFRIERDTSNEEIEGRILHFDKGRAEYNTDNPIFDGETFVMDDKEYDILFTFDNAERTEKYIVYTDNSHDEEGNVQIFASKYIPGISREKLLPIDDDIERETVEGLFSYAMEQATNNNEKINEGDEDTEVKIDPFNTLCYLAQAIGSSENNETSFILATTGKEDNEDMYGVTLCGNFTELKTLLGYTMTSFAKKEKEKGTSVLDVYDMFSTITVNSVETVYTNEKLKREIERIVSEENKDFDIDNFLEGD